MTNGAVYRTPKMALVAYLRVRAFSYDSMELKGDQVIWVFRDSESLQRELDEYRSGDACVEPVEFTRATARVRDEMFRFKQEQDERSAAHNGATAT